MTRESILMQYQSECLEALKSVANIGKPFEKVFMDAMKLFMAIPGRINFLQMGRYGKFSEQTYRNHFVNESFDWFSFNEHLVKEHLPGTRKAIAGYKKSHWRGSFLYSQVRKENPMAGIFPVRLCRRIQTGT